MIELVLVCCNGRTYHLQRWIHPAILNIVTHTTQGPECKRIRKMYGKYLRSHFSYRQPLCGLDFTCTFSIINLLLLFHVCLYKFFHSDVSHRLYSILHNITGSINQLNKSIWFGLVSLFNGISTLFRLFNVKTILLEEQ